MKDLFLQVSLSTPQEARLNIAREYLQRYILRLIQELGYSPRLDLLGGTALRILHQLPRFSEDLDFSARGKGKSALDPSGLFTALKSQLEKAGYDVSVKAKMRTNVANAFIRFVGAPAELELRNDRRASLSVKVEVDMAPPHGADSTVTLVQAFFPIAIRHYGITSLFAGKLHVILQRPYIKGRDWYDLVWYLTEKRGIEPNGVLLENALLQTGGDSSLAQNWRSAVKKRFEALDWDEVKEDVRPFLERPSDLAQIGQDQVRKLLVR